MFAGALKYQWRSCENSRGHESASIGRKIGNKGRESACIAHESATRGLEIVAETVRVFAGPFSYNGGRVTAVETMKGPIEAVSRISKSGTKSKGVLHFVPLRRFYAVLFIPLFCCPREKCGRL